MSTQEKDICPEQEGGVCKIVRAIMTSWHDSSCALQDQRDFASGRKLASTRCPVINFYSALRNRKQPLNPEV